MVSEALANKLIEFAKKHKLIYSEINRRDWGSFEPVLTFDGHSWFHCGDAFGWAYQPPIVTSEIMIRHRNNPVFQAWIGYERLTELNEILNGHVEPEEPINERE